MELPSIMGSISTSPTRTHADASSVGSEVGSARNSTSVSGGVGFTDDFTGHSINGSHAHLRVGGNNVANAGDEGRASSPQNSLRSSATGAFTSDSEELSPPLDEELMEEAGVRAMSLITAPLKLESNSFTVQHASQNSIYMPSSRSLHGNPPLSSYIFEPDHRSAEDPAAELHGIHSITSSSTAAPPSELAINTLTDMGFQREAAIGALLSAGNIVELAANFLADPNPGSLGANHYTATTTAACGIDAHPMRSVAIIQAGSKVKSTQFETHLGAAEMATAAVRNGDDTTPRRSTSQRTSGTAAAISLGWPSRQKARDTSSSESAPSAFSLLRFSSKRSRVVPIPQTDTAQPPSLRVENRAPSPKAADTASVSSEDLSPEPYVMTGLTTSALKVDAFRPGDRPSSRDGNSTNLAERIRQTVTPRSHLTITVEAGGAQRMIPSSSRSRLELPSTTVSPAKQDAPETLDVLLPGHADT